MKKLLLSLLGALIALPTLAADYDFQIDGIYYKKTGDNTCEVTSSVNGSYFGSIIIPSSFNYLDTEYLVTSIDTYAFSGSSRLTSVTLPNTITVVSKGVFSGCRALTSVTIPNSVTQIDDWAFYNCQSLYSVTIPNSVTRIGNVAFSGCSLTSITIPNSVTYIGSSAFGSCNNLTSVTIPNSVTEIGSSAFGGCVRLSTIDVVVNNNNYASINGVLFSKDCSNLICFPMGKQQTDYSIPNSVTKIGYFAFSQCSTLNSVSIPTSVTEIEERGFDRCTGLNSITIPNSVKEIGKMAFFSCTAMKSVIISNSVIQIGERVFDACTELTSVTYLSQNPVAGWKNSFDDQTYENATLYYLGETKDIIDVREPWSLFKNRVGRDADFKDDSAISEVQNSNDGATEVYNLRGIRVGESTEGLPHGIYIVKSAGKTRKIAI